MGLGTWWALYGVVQEEDAEDDGGAEAEAAGAEAAGAAVDAADEADALDPPSDAAALPLSLVAAAALTVLAAAPVAASPELAPGLASLLRKSVTYQPEPLSWKPAAVSCFLKVSLLQLGQTVNSGSLIF